TMNRIVDLRYDRENPRTRQRALVTGALSLEFAWLFTLLAVAVFFAAAWQLNPLAVKLAPLAIAILFFYSFTKRFTNWSHLFLGFALGISPAAAWIAVTGGLDWRMLILCAAVTLWVGGFDVLYACQDVDYDKAARLFSIPRRFGIAKALLIARGMHVGVIALLSWLALSLGLPWPSWAGIAVVAVLLAYEHSLIKGDDLSKLDAERVLAGERLSFDDGITLYRSPDLLAVGWLANHMHEKKHGNVTYYNVNRHINPTNICVAHCKLCAFGRDQDAPGAYNFALEEIYQRAEQGMREGALEFHIVGGLHPDLPFEYFLDMMRGLKKRCPGVHLKAFTMVEVGYFARIARLTVKEVLLKLKEAGVDSLPGGGAEIFHPRVRKIICDHKVSGQMWLNIARQAHEIGLRSN